MKNIQTLLNQINEFSEVMSRLKSEILKEFNEEEQILKNKLIDFEKEESSQILRKQDLQKQIENFNSRDAELKIKEKHLEDSTKKLLVAEKDLSERENAFKKHKEQLELVMSIREEKVLQGTKENEEIAQRLKEIRKVQSDKERQLNDKYSTLQKSMDELRK